MLIIMVMKVMVPRMDDMPAFKTDLKIQLAEFRKDTI